MKKIGEYSTRGSYSDSGTPLRITLFDGRFDTAYKIVSFQIAPNNMTAGTDDCVAVLATEAAAATSAQTWDWGDNRQIGWASWASWDVNSIQQEKGIIDEENLVVEDLYLAVHHRNDESVNYMLHLEKYDISDWRGALAMVRNRSQT